MSEPMGRAEYDALCRALEDGAPTPDLATFRRAEALDSNFLWRIPAGHVHNLLDSAMERIEELESEASEPVADDEDTLPSAAGEADSTVPAAPGSVEQRWALCVYRDYDGEELILAEDPDGDGIWIDKRGEGPVYVPEEDRRTVAAQIDGRRAIGSAGEMDALPEGSVVLALADGHQMMGEDGGDSRFRWPHAYESSPDEPGFWFSTLDGDGFGATSFFHPGAPEVILLREGAGA